MTTIEQKSLWRLLLVSAILLLLVYGVSLSICFVYFIRDYSSLKEHVEGLKERVERLEKDRVTARATAMPLGDHTQREADRLMHENLQKVTSSRSRYKMRIHPLPHMHGHTSVRPQREYQQVAGNYYNSSQIVCLFFHCVNKLLFKNIS